MTRILSSPVTMWIAFAYLPFAFFVTMTWHFPQLNNGEYAGHHPADSQAAIEQVRSLAARGAQYLIVPASVSVTNNENSTFESAP